MVCFPELQTALSISKSKLQLLETVFSLHFSKIYFQLSYPLSLDSERLHFQSSSIRHTNALNVARLHLAVLVLGGLTEGQHRPKAGKKKKTREAGLFFLVPAS